jgi:hypothetical protein
LFTLGSEIVFSADHQLQLPSCLLDNMWLQGLPHLADIFTEINELNLPFEGMTITTILLCEKTVFGGHQKMSQIAFNNEQLF